MEQELFRLPRQPQQNNYDPATQSYVTQWMDFGTGVRAMPRPRQPRTCSATATPAGAAAAGEPSIVRPTALDPATSSMICAQCHSLRDVVAPGYTAGDDYYDYFMPLLEFGPRHEQRSRLLA